jgi:hypothetical protein
LVYVDRLEYFFAQVDRLEYFFAQVDRLEYFFAQVDRLEYFFAQVETGNIVDTVTVFLKFHSDFLFNVYKHSCTICVHRH